MSPAARRPPGPSDSLATVTQLSPPGERRERVPVAAVQGTLALDLDRVPEQPAVPELRPLPTDGTRDDREVRLWAARFAQAIVEVLGGDRPLSQLLRWTDARVYADLERRTRILGRRSPGARDLRSVRPQVRSVHVCRPSPAVAEVSVHVRHGHRSRALAARLEQRGDRWLCVALQLG
jgi:Family of unknown function (DUF6459)